MLVISEYTRKRAVSAGMLYLRKMEEALRLLGIPLINFERGNIDSLEVNLERLGSTIKIEKVYWLGFVPRFEIYEKVAAKLSSYGYQLVNSPIEFSQSEYFDQFYPLIESETMPSEIVCSKEEVITAANRIGYPVFLKGRIQSLKKYGWENCVANNEDELLSIFGKLAEAIDYSLGTIIVRKFINFKYLELGGHGIPQAHEYRFFVLNDKIIDYCYYWNGRNPFQLGLVAEEMLKTKVIDVSKKVSVPFISVDVGETLEGVWKVIEIGDGQFSDIRSISPLKFWTYISSV